MSVTPDRVRRVPTLFGKNGAVAPWFAAVAGSVIVYFRVSHLEQSRSVYLTAALKAAPVLVLHVLTRKLVEFGVFDQYAKFIGRGLLCFAAGGILLETEFGFSPELWSTCALVACLMGHLFYIGAFTLGARRDDFTPIVILPATLYALGFFVILYSFSPSIHPLLLLAYVSIVTAMVLSSICHSISLTTVAARWSRNSAIGGAVLLLASDSIMLINTVFCILVHNSHISL